MRLKLYAIEMGAAKAMPSDLPYVERKRKLPAKVYLFLI